MSVDEVWKALDAVKDVMLGACGGIVAYLFDYSKASRDGDATFVFKFSALMINMVLGMFVAYSVGTFIPLDVIGRDAYIGGSGVFAYSILLVAESKAAIYLFEMADRIVGKSKKEK